MAIRDSRSVNQGWYIVTHDRYVIKLIGINGVLILMIYLFLFQAITTMIKQ